MSKPQVVINTNPSPQTVVGTTNGNRVVVVQRETPKVVVTQSPQNTVVTATKEVPKVVISSTGAQGVPGRGIVSFDRVSGDGTPGSDDTYRVVYTDGTYVEFTIHQGIDGDGTGSGPWIDLQEHITHPTPHNAYDDMQSLTILFENGLTP